MSNIVNKEIKALKKAINKEIGIPFLGSILDRKHRASENAAKSAKGASGTDSKESGVRRLVGAAIP